MRIMQTIPRIGYSFVVFALGAVALAAQAPSTQQTPPPANQASPAAQQPPAVQQPPDPAADALRAGQQLMRDG